MHVNLQREGVGNNVRRAARKAMLFKNATRTQACTPALVLLRMAPIPVRDQPFDRHRSEDCPVAAALSARPAAGAGASPPRGAAVMLRAHAP